ncbi:MAG: hypothetical protein I8H77_14475 [Comamonadaceae bacterium]|nr:hypothetical protein [Comamonadaceae bacterium]
MNSAAKEIRDAAFQTLMGSLASGGLTMGSGAFQAKNAMNNLSSLKELNSTPQTTPASTPTPGSASALKADAGTKPGDIEMTEMKRWESTPNTASERTADARAKSGDVGMTTIEKQEPKLGENQQSKSQISPDESNAVEQKRASAAQQDAAKRNEKRMSESVQEEQPTQPETKRMKLDGSDPQPEPAAPTAKEAAQEPEQTKQPTERDVKLRELDQSAAKLRGMSDTAHGLGSASNAFFQNSAASHQARKAELEAESKAHDIALQGAGDAIQTTMEQIRSWRDILQAVNQGNIETTRGIARNI